MSTVKAFKIKKHIRSTKDDGINDYIEELENYILSLRASNTNQLIFKLDEINGEIVEDLDKIMAGEAFRIETVDGMPTEISNLNVLNDSKDSKIFDRVMVLFGKLKDLKGVADYVSAMIPEIEEEESIASKIKITKGANVLEQISEQFRKDSK